MGSSTGSGILGLRDKAKACTLCNTHFTLLRRVHHCRQCGAAVCSACSSHTMPVRGSTQRVCDACFNAQSVNMFREAEDEARSRASKAATGELKLEPPPKPERRAPLKLAIPASLSYLEQNTAQPGGEGADPSETFASPLSPQFAGSSSSSPSSTSVSSLGHSLPGSEVTSPPATPTAAAAASSGGSARVSVNIPTVPSVAALSASSSFAGFKSKIGAYHASISASEAEWEKRLEKRRRAERPGLRDRLAYVSSIVETMKKEQRKKEAAGTATTPEEDERLAYFISLRDGYAHQLDQVELDIHFPDPTMRRYKLRVNAAEERITLAAEDVALERVSGVFKATVKGSHMQMEVSDVVARLIVYHFALAGKGTKVWGHFVKPDRVSLQLTIRRILIPLSYYSTKSKDLGRWVVDRAGAVFDLHVVKSIRGSASVPDSLIAWIIDKQVPKALLGVFEDLVPGELGQLFASNPDHHVSLQGGFDVHCAFSNAVWEADLAGNSADSEAARQLLVPPSSSASSSLPPALLQARMALVNNILQAARVHKVLPTLTLNGVAAYIRRFSCSIDNTAQALWLKLLTEWQLMVNDLENAQSLWFFSFIERVAELDDKPLVLHFALNQINVGVGLVSATQWYLDAAIKAVAKRMQDEKKKRAAIAAGRISRGGSSSQLAVNGSRHSLLVPSRTAASGTGSAPSSPLTGGSASTNSPSSRRSAAGGDEDDVATDSLSNFIGDDKAAKPRAPLTLQQSRPRSSSHPNLESPRAQGAQSIQIDAAEHPSTADEAVEEAVADLSDADIDSLMTIALDWQKTVQASLAAALDVVKSLSLTVAGSLTGGPPAAHPASSEDAQLSVWVSRLSTQLTMPPLKVTIGALEFIKESITTTPQLKIATRVNPQSGSLESLTQIIDPATGLRYTYHFAFSAGALNLFPVLLAHQQQQLFTSSLSAPPAVTFTLDETRLEGSLKPALDFDKYIHLEEKANVIRAAGSTPAEKAAEVEKQNEEERVRRSMLTLIKGAPAVDVAAILLPYVLHRDHDMKVTVKLQIAVTNNDPALARQAAINNNAASASDAYKAAATNGSAGNEALPALTIPEDNGAHASGPTAPSAVGTVTTISLLSSSSSVLAINTAEVAAKLNRYRHVVLSVDTPSASRLQAIESKREQLGKELPDEIVVPTNQQVIEPEQICVDVHFRATLAELITDILQLTLG